MDAFGELGRVDNPSAFEAQIATSRMKCPAFVIDR